MHQNKARYIEMKATGIIRRIDDLGRIVIPKEIRRSLFIREGDPMELFIENGGVTFRKYNILEDDIFDTIERAMKKTNRSYALYDRHIKRTGYHDSNYPNKVPDEWLDERQEFIQIDCENTNAVYPIYHSGDIWGYICTDKTNDDYIRGVISMAVSSLVDAL